MQAVDWGHTPYRFQFSLKSRSHIQESVGPSITAGSKMNNVHGCGGFKDFSIALFPFPRKLQMTTNSVFKRSKQECLAQALPDSCLRARIVGRNASLVPAFSKPTRAETPPCLMMAAAYLGWPARHSIAPAKPQNKKSLDFLGDETLLLSSIQYIGAIAFNQG